jgi:DNA mismatch repair protein MutL
MAIRVLPPEVAERIAAGEVVERPASVVKELLENALDAGARRIAIEVRGGGLELVRVSDDGCGIIEEELELAFARHATSKIASAEDLWAIDTLGFRGEALPSIAAVADVELASRPPEREEGAWVRLEGGRVVARGQRGMPPGTVVTVTGLFTRHPARRKFLRSPQGEAQAIAQVVSHYALAYPEVRLSLLVDGRRLLATPGSGELRDAVAAIYGVETAGALLPVDGEHEGVRVAGLVGPPHLHRAGRGQLSFFVNRRWVQNRRLAFALEEAYQGLLPAGRHPVAVLSLTLPPGEVDVNVHPAKAEVRFRREGAVLGAVARATRAALVAEAPVPRPAAASPTADGREAPLLWQRAASPPRRKEEAGPRPQQPPSPTPRRVLPLLRVVGQVANLYIVAEGPDGMYLIDQHAAHERVLFEEIAAQRARGKVERQGLLPPLLLELTPAQAAALEECAGALTDHGFELEPFGERAYLLRSVPSLLAARGGDVREAVLSLLDRLREGTPPPPDRVAMTLACHAAVRAGKALSLEEMRELVRRLEETQTPHTCPHGRPTMLQLTADALARQFGRR